MRTTTAAREVLVGAILADVSESLRELRCASTDRFVKHGVNMTQIHVLRQLEQHGAVSMSRIAELLDVSVSNATVFIDRMVERGLVERVGVPDDRRVVLVRPAAGGRRVLDETEGIKLEQIRTICDRLDDIQLRRISRAIADLRGAIAEEYGPGTGQDGSISS